MFDQKTSDSITALAKVLMEKISEELNAGKNFNDIFTPPNEVDQCSKF